MNPRYDLVIFDFDGTLADSTSWMVANLNRIARRHRFREVTAAEIEALRGRGTREIMAYLGVKSWQLPFIANDMRKMSALDAASIPLYPGVPDLVRDLSDAGVTLAVVSSNGEKTVRKVLGPARHFFDVFSCGAPLFGKARKLRSVARRVAAAATRVLCVGDETRDVEAAKACGFDSAAVTWGYATVAALASANPTFKVGNVAELRALLEGRPVLVELPGSNWARAGAGL